MSNTDVIHRFYAGFQKGDYKSMQDCYSDKAVFSDPVFTNLNSDQVKSMWEMLCKRAADLQIEYTEVQADAFTGSAKWTARYTFSSTNKNVVNTISSAFKFENGKIIEHIDSFSFYRWARQALGMPGLLLGWTGFLKAKFRASAMKSLNAFMQKNLR